MSSQEIIHAYRHLLRAGLHAVQFSLPARLVIQSQLRKAFRQPPSSSSSSSSSSSPEFDPEAIRRTVWFLKAAAAERGLEHKIVKNLVRIAWTRDLAVAKKFQGAWRADVASAGRSSRKVDPIKATAYEHYEATIAMLNHSMGLCLPLR